MVKARADSYRELIRDLTFELGEFFADPKITERSLILADTVCYELWGGSRGWEVATDEQFNTLVRQLKERLRNGNQDKERPKEESNPKKSAAAPLSQRGFRHETR